MGDEPVVWYVAYGSNLCAARFRCYLAGGSPDGSTSRRYPPCPTGAEILADRPVLVGHRLSFARSSRNWAGGGVAFVDVRPTSPAPTYGRARLMTVDQFRHLVCQENAGADVAVDARAFTGEPTELVGGGWYRLLLPVRPIDGIAAVTLTGRPRPPTVPHPTYLTTMRAGLRETWPHLTEPEIDAYLASVGEGP